MIAKRNPKKNRPVFLTELSRVSINFLSLTVQFSVPQWGHLSANRLQRLAKELVKTDEEKEKIIKFLESDDPGMVRMGASMLKGILKE